MTEKDAYCPFCNERVDTEERADGTYQCEKCGDSLIYENEEQFKEARN